MSMLNMQKSANTSSRTIEDSLRDLEGFFCSTKLDKSPNDSIMGHIPRDSSLFDNIKVNNFNESSTFASKIVDSTDMNWHLVTPSNNIDNNSLITPRFNIEKTDNDMYYKTQNTCNSLNNQSTNGSNLLQETNLNTMNNNFSDCMVNDYANFNTSNTFYNNQITNNYRYNENNNQYMANSNYYTTKDNIYKENYNNAIDQNEENCMKVSSNNKKPIKSNAIIPTWIQIPNNSKFFIIKCNSIENIKKSFYNGIWSSTKFGNKRLSNCYKNLNKWEKIFLFFSVNGSGKFCGVAEMISDINDNLDTTIWENNSNCKFNNAFKCRWIIVRDINNKYLKKFLLPNNEMKPLTNSRDTQEIPFTIGCSLIKIFKSQNVDIEKKSFLDVDY